MSPPSRRPVSDREIVERASALYLVGKPIDMSNLAVDVGLARATLYRRVGNHDTLLATVLADQTEVTFRRARRGVDRIGMDGVTATLESFIRDVIASDPVRSLIDRDPATFLRVVMGPGLVEDRATHLVTEVLRDELEGHLTSDPRVLARAIVRVSDAMIYSHLLGNGGSQVDDALSLVRLLLDASVQPI